MKHIKLILILFTISIITIFSCNDKDTTEPGCSPLNIGDETHWRGPFAGNNDTVLYIPDEYAVYWYFVIDRTNNPNQYIQINGNYGNARYMSYNVYDLNSLTSSGSILDKQLIPHCDSYNPFTPGENVNGTSTIYSVNIVPSSINIEIDNQLNFSDNIDKLIVMLRYYVYETDFMAGVPLPIIVGKDPSNNSDVELNFSPDKPSVDVSQFTDQMNDLSKVGNLNSIGFWKTGSNGLLANNDNKYLIGPSIVSSDELAVIRLQPPSFQTDFSIPADVRYWSINIGDNKTLNYNGIKDDDAIVADDGWTYFVFGRDNNDVKAKCDQIKYNFVEWKMPTDTAFFIYRNLVSENFPGNLDNVDSVDTEKPIEGLIEYRADKQIGNYAPRGEKVTVIDFINSK